MNGLGLLERVKRWFSGPGRAADPAPPSAKRCSLGPAGADADLSLGGIGAAIAGIAAPSERSQAGATYPADSAFARTSADGPAAGSHRSLSIAPSPATPDASLPPHLDPLDPSWMQSLEELPQRIAESVAERAAGTEALEQIGRELDGHRQATRAIAGAVRRLPEMAGAQAELTRETNKCLERQALVMESMLDGITGLRAAFRTVDESSRRHLKAIAQLEASHRQVLFEYQAMLVAAHRRVSHLATLGILLAAAAIAGVGYAIYLVATLGQ